MSFDIRGWQPHGEVTMRRGFLPANSSVPHGAILAEPPRRVCSHGDLTVRRVPLIHEWTKLKVTSVFKPTQ